MLPLILGPIISMLADKGLELAAGAIDGGAEKAKEFIEEKTGVKLDPKKGLSASDVQAIKKLENDPETKIKLEELALANKKEDNRHDEAKMQKDVDLTKNAQNMNTKIQESENSSALAKVAAYYIDFFVIGATMLLACIILFAEIPKGNVQIVNIMFGAMLGYVGTIIQYHRGSSHSSQSKDDHIKTLTKGK